MSSLRQLVESLNKPAPELPDVEDPHNAEDLWTRKELLTSEVNEDDLSLSVRRFRSAISDDEGEVEKVSAGQVFSGEGISGISLRANFPNSYEEAYDKDGSAEGSVSEVVEEDESSSEESENVRDSDDDGELYQASEKSNEDKADAIALSEVLLSPNIDQQIRKGKCIQSQLGIWDMLIHLAIKVHSALRAYNRLPRGKLAKSLLKTADEETAAKYKQARKNIYQLLETLLLIENALLWSSKQTAALVTQKGGEGVGRSDEEEIESTDDEQQTGGAKKVCEDDDDEIDEENILYSENESESGKEVESAGMKKRKKYRTLDQFNNENQTLTKWDERTHLMNATKVRNKNFSAFDSLVLKQIDQIMSDKRRLIRRTQTKRSDVDRIGGNLEATHDPEIFDDDDFYQQILRELIERKTINTTDPVEMSRQWIEIQQLRQKRSKKKKVDTKASKGRKLRYVVIPKLVNYFPSMPETVKWSHEMRNQLFKSLFTSAL